MSFGNKTVEGNCCVRTKTGAVIVIPAGMINNTPDELKKTLKGGEIIGPLYYQNITGRNSRSSSCHCA